MAEIESVGALEAALRRRHGLTGSRLQGLDLRDHEPELLSRKDFRGAVVLGGVLSQRLERHIQSNGGVIFPAAADAPVDAYRGRLYHPRELYAGLATQGYQHTPDARAYRWAQDGALAGDAATTMTRAIHDDSISDALAEAVHGLDIAGIMGGHALERGTQEYAATARLGHRLAGAGLTVATGGGPGLMEAANLGAFCDDEPGLDRALSELAGVPGFRPSIDAWAEIALKVRDELAPGSPGHVPSRPGAARSIGVPTWFYGHEPPNVFCDGIAKYFSNALREDGLLALATAGIVVMPGAAGTVQEVFQVATRLFYAGEDTPIPHLVLVGSHYWREQLPAWPLLQALAAERRMMSRIHLVDDVSDAADVLLERPA